MKYLIILLLNVVITKYFVPECYIYVIYIHGDGIAVILSQPNLIQANQKHKEMEIFILARHISVCPELKLASSGK